MRIVAAVLCGVWLVDNSPTHAKTTPRTASTARRVPSAQAALAFAECSNLTTLRGSGYMVWTVTDAIALGNALSVYLNTYLSALCVRESLQSRALKRCTLLRSIA